jgi:CO dehydrogenase/acetyl-CoA synthase alpha subunit
MRNMLVSQLGYLAMMLNRADQVPGKDAYERYDELSGLLQKIIAEYGQLK